MMALERIQFGSPWRRRPAVEKLILGLGLLLLALMLPVVPGALLVLFASTAVLLLGARIGAKDYLRVLSAPAAFLLAGAIALAVTVGWEESMPMLRVTAASVATAATTSLRALAATSALLVIVLTVPLTDLLKQLQRLRVPGPILELMLLTWRFVALTLEVAGRTRQAQANRLGYTGTKRAIHSTGLLAAALLPRVLDRAARLEIGLAARGYTGELRTLSATTPVSPRFVAAALVLQGGIAVLSLAWSTYPLYSG